MQNVTILDAIVLPNAMLQSLRFLVNVKHPTYALVVLRDIVKRGDGEVMSLKVAKEVIDRINQPWEFTDETFTKGTVVNGISDVPMALPLTNAIDDPTKVTLEDVPVHSYIMCS